VKSLEDIQVFFRKYMIHCFGLCQCFEGIWPPVEKGILSGLQWCFSFGGGMFAEISTIRNKWIKIVKILNWGVTRN
jgi:hypothetical protein